MDEVIIFCIINSSIYRLVYSTASLSFHDDMEAKDQERLDL